MSIRNILEAVAESFQILHDLSLKKKDFLPTYKHSVELKRGKIYCFCLLRLWL